jgi:hypothetical protein
VAACGPRVRGGWFCAGSGDVTHHVPGVHELSGIHAQNNSFENHFFYIFGPRFLDSKFPLRLSICYVLDSSGHSLLFLLFFRRLNIMLVLLTKL